ncbi:MAG: aminopeptidase [Thermoplasmata archaeon]
MEEGARLVLKTSAALKVGEKVLILADDTTRTVGEAFVAAARGLGADPVLACIAPRKRDGDEPPDPVGIAMESADVVVLVTGRSLTHTHARRQANRAGARVISIPGVTEDLLREGGLATDWSEVHNALRRTARRLRGAREVRLTSASGTDLTFSVAARDWVTEDTGLCARKGAFTTLPAGELFIAPGEDSAEGRLVANLYFGEPLLEPATAILTQGHATRIVGAPKAVHEMNLGGRDGRTLGRFGFGLNRRARVDGPHMEAEKALGCANLGFGDNLVIGGKIHCGVRIEVTISEVGIEVDGKSVIEKGRLVE